jgi:hypothetical protein
MVKGHRKKVVAEWRHTRFIGYLIATQQADPKQQIPSIFEWYPLEDDPTKEELEEERRKKVMEGEDQAMKILREYEEMGLIKRN